MVLRRTFFCLLMMLSLTFVGCIGAQQAVRTKIQTPLVSVFVEPVPAEYSDKIAGELRRRNLLVQQPPAEAFFEAFRSRRSIDQRLKVLQAAHSGLFLMLVESEVRFYSFLSGKFRWNVTGRVTFVQPDGTLQTTPFELAAFLDFEHQNEADALRYVELAVAERIGQAADRFLAGVDSVEVVLPN
jgi:hypothetical protein